MAKIALKPIHYALRLELEKYLPDYLTVTAVFSNGEKIEAYVRTEDLTNLLGPNTPIGTWKDYPISNLTRIIKPDLRRIIFCFHPSSDGENNVVIRLDDLADALSQL